MSALAWLLGGDAALLALSLAAIVAARRRARRRFRLRRRLRALFAPAGGRPRSSARPSRARGADAADRPAVDRREFSPRRAVGVLRRGGRPRRGRREPLRHRLRARRARTRARAAVLSGLSGRHEFRAARRRRLHVPRRLGVHVARLVGAGDGPSPRTGQSRAPAMSISLWRASARWRCCSPSRCWRARRAPTPSRRCAPARPRPAWPVWCSLWRWRARGRRPALCRSTSGCRSPIPPRRATSRR